MRKLVFVLCIGCFWGCSDFLNLLPKNKQIVANLEDVKTELFVYLSSITYNTPSISPSYGSTTFRFPFYNDIAAQLCLYEDDIDMTHFSDHQDVDNGCMEIYNESIDWRGVEMAKSLWDNCYGTIGFMNAILDDLEKVGNYTKQEYETIVGEAKIIRAYHIFKLLQFFSPYHNNEWGIPLNLDSENVEPGGRKTQKEVYSILIDELTEILEFETGSEKWNIFYRPEIAKALLAQIYWYKAGSGAAEESDWANAEKYSAELIGSYVPENESDVLRDIFSSGIKEYVTLNPNYLLRFSYLKAWGFGDIRTGIWAQGNAQHISEELFNLYGSDDIRLEAWFKYVDDEGTAFYGVDKPAYTDNMSEITVLFRMADLYLINAEAHFHLNDLPKAREMLEVFKAARKDQGSDFSDDEILDEIFKERRKEFCYELGSRWIDMKRLGLKVSRLGINKDGAGMREYALEADDYRYTLPIPEDSELDYNKIEQNPGWGAIN